MGVCGQVLSGNFTRLWARSKASVYFSSGTLRSARNVTLSSGATLSSKDAIIRAAYLLISSSSKLHR